VNGAPGPVGKRGDPLAKAINDVVRTERCTGCGVCVHLDRRVRMTDASGFKRPVVGPGPIPRHPHDLTRVFRKVCPGVEVRAQRPPGGHRDRTLGPVAGLWKAWAADREFRRDGSSGGTLSALAAWLVSSGRNREVVGAGPAPSDPRTTVPVRITTREEALAATGSRYAPVSVGSVGPAVDADSAVICKPCEAYALRRLAEQTGTLPPLLLTFFCAGTPSQQATEDLLGHLGVNPDRELTELRYRGRGWPGAFNAKTVDGARVGMEYQSAWASHLGPHVQWRCRTCPDGVGEAGDLTAGDLWLRGPDGLPRFTEAPGTSVLIARTARGRALLDRADAEGVLIRQPVAAADVVAVQPYQLSRRRLLLARLVATAVLRRSVTRARGFGIVGSALRDPLGSYRELRGTVARLRHRGRIGVRS
jgi:coenzyme F420 hydrogenase subunit beta